MPLEKKFFIEIKGTANSIIAIQGRFLRLRNIVGR